MKKLLIIDDDEGLCRLISDCLQLEGFSCECALNGIRGMEMLREQVWALVVLDVMMPGCGGFEVLKYVRQSADLNTLPVLMLTARSDEMDRIAGLESGADDYLTKPFSPGELAARIRAILRRADMQAQGGQPVANLGSVKVAGDLQLNSASLRLSIDNQLVPVTPVEFRIVEMLLENCGNMVPRDDLANAALGHSLRPLERTLDIHISRIRAKLGNHKDGSPRIRAIRGEGYVYLLPEE